MVCVVHMHDRVHDRVQVTQVASHCREANLRDKWQTAMEDSDSALWVAEAQNHSED